MHFRRHLVLENDVQSVNDTTASKSVRVRMHHIFILSRSTYGMYPSTVSRMLINRSAPHPRSRKTPTGGRKMARMILMMSLSHMSVHDAVCVASYALRRIPLHSDRCARKKLVCLPSGESHFCGCERGVLLWWCSGCVLCDAGC